MHGPRVLVLTPTRELAMQVAKAAVTYGRHVPGLRVATIVGGVPYHAQLKALRGPLDVLIATPGRLHRPPAAARPMLANVEMLVLDEADRMLDMGFIDDIQHIADATPEQRQTVMFSATFAGDVGPLADQLMRDAQKIDVASHTDTHADIEQRLHWADDHEHKNALLEHILTERSIEQALVFTSTQRDADWLADRLADMGHRWRRCTAACRRAGATACCKACARATCACSSPPTWPRAASTCRASATSSTTACR